MLGSRVEINFCFGSLNRTILEENRVTFMTVAGSFLCKSNDNTYE